MSISQNLINSRQNNGGVATIPKASTTNPTDIRTTRVEEEARVTEDEKIIEISKILTAWNPLGERAAAMKDLDNYQTEAMDILSGIELYGHSPKKAAAAVLQEAFLINLEETELDHYSRKIQTILAKQ